MGAFGFITIFAFVLPIVQVLKKHKSFKMCAVKYTKYRSGTVNSKSFISKVLL